MNTTIDDVSLRGSVYHFGLQTKYSRFLNKQQKRHCGNDMPGCVQCFPLSGFTTNSLAFEFLQKDRIEATYDHETFKTETKLSEFLQKIHKTHAISFDDHSIVGHGSSLTWDEWSLLATALNPDLRKVS